MEVIVTTGAIKGAEVGFSNSWEPTQRIGWCGPKSEREVESAEFKSIYSPRSPLPLIDTDKCCLDPHSRVNRASEENNFSECLAPN